MTRFGIFSSFFLLIALTAGSQEDLDSCSTKTWLEQPQEVVTLLETAEIVSVEEVGMGVTKPWRVDFRHGSEQFSALYKPIKRGRKKGFWESYEAEVERTLDALAAHLETHLDIDGLLEVAHARV